MVQTGILGSKIKIKIYLQGDHTPHTLKYSIQNVQMSNVKYQISVFHTEIGFHRIPTGE